MKTWIVEITNYTDHRDNETVKVKAETEKEAGDIALSNYGWVGRGGIRCISPARHTFTNKDIKQILKWRRKGDSYAHISWHYRCSATTIRNLILKNKNKKEFKVKKRVKK